MQQTIEMVPAAIGVRAGRVAVGEDAVCGDVAGAREIRAEAFEAAKLRGGGLGRHKVSHQTDADASTVIEILRCVSRMGAGELLRPARADLDFAIAASLAIADYEMIAQAIAPAATKMGFVEYGGTAGGRRGMVYDDILPAFGLLGGNSP